MIDWKEHFLSYLKSSAYYTGVTDETKHIHSRYFLENSVREKLDNFFQQIHTTQFAWMRMEYNKFFFSVFFILCSNLRMVHSIGQWCQLSFDRIGNENWILKMAIESWQKMSMSKRHSYGSNKKRKPKRLTMLQTNMRIKRAKV